MFVALGLSRCMFSLSYFRLHSLPLLSPLLLSVVSVGYFRALPVFGAAWLRAFAARPLSETLRRKAVVTGRWQVFLRQFRAKRLIEGYAEKSCLHRDWEAEK